jgi:hypothetical protein
MPQQSIAPVLFESSDNLVVEQDPANSAWLAIIRLIAGRMFELLARRYYQALCHLRGQPSRPGLPGQVEIAAPTRQQALQGMLEQMEQRKARRGADEASGAHGQAADMFVDPSPNAQDESLPLSLRDFSVPPLPLSVLLDKPGRPPCDALCLLRAFLAAPALGVDDDPTSVFHLLRSNPTFAHKCGFLGRNVCKQPGELTSRRLPSLATCEEFSEVMTRYGLWHLACVEQVKHNLATGVVAAEDTAAFDTTHIVANSHCANVVPPDAKVEDGQKPKHRKVPRMFKRCTCGQDHWEGCEHPWVPTDQGAAVVVKGTTRIYWAHKASVVSLGDSEIPIDVRVCLYAAESDGKTLVPHLELLRRDLPEVVTPLRFILADDAYKENTDAVRRFGQQARLICPVHGRTARAGLAERFRGIDHFTPIGVPVCDGGHRFEFFGRDIEGQRYIWRAPLNDQGLAVCGNCAHKSTCLKRGDRRHIRVDRQDQPQIDWAHPQHFARDRARYQQRTGVERAIKRLKVDLLGAHLTHRDALRVQASLDRKLLTLHLLLQNAT